MLIGVDVAITRRDVARLAGTSPAVVSYVLNGGPRGVAPKTRARVVAAVEQLGYRPNRIARSLRMNRTLTIGLVVPDNSNPYFAELARAVEEAAFAAGYTMLLGNATDDEERQTTYVRTFLDRQVDGLLLIPSHLPVACLPDLQRSGVPWVLLDRSLPEPVVSQVVVENREGARRVTRHLLDHGCGAVACIAGPTDVPPAFERVAGWRSALADAGLTPEPGWERHVAFGRTAGYHAALDLLRANSTVDAIFAASDEQALGALRAITELGLRCPDDVALASFDGIPASAYAIPALTTARQPVEALGEAAVAQLLREIADPEAEPSTVSLPVRLLVRGSCGCPDPPGGDSESGTDSDGRTGEGSE